MSGILQPEHLVFLVVILVILFGPGELSELGKGLGHGVSEMRDGRGVFRSVLFMAKGIDPAVGRDVGDMLPDDEAQHRKLWARCVVAMGSGNLMYFAAAPFLPV